jgi:benzoyl-CoA reductase/2-hydroxyglutaryl-CoA dehydratase subunit BcrC/BadD/HgdB
MILRRLQFETAKHVVAPFLTRLDHWQTMMKKSRKKGGGTLFGPPLTSVDRLKDLMMQYYFRGRYADGAVPVAWVTSGFPSEVLVALGYHLVYPENHAALCGARKTVVSLSETAEAEGFSRDLCSYARTDIGALLSGKTPVGRLPRPDLLACCTNICQTVMYWYRSLAAYLDVPLVIIDTPFVYGEAPQAHYDYVGQQLEVLREVAEKVAGTKLDSVRFDSVITHARDASALWGKCLDTGKARPSPWSAIDSFFHIAPVVTLRGSPECTDYYRSLLQELEERAQAGIGAITNERHRLLWDNLPIWFMVRELAKETASRGFQFVCATYSNAWAEAGESIDPSDPLGSTARTYTKVYLNRDLASRLETMKDLATRFSVDGAVLHSDRSCKPYSVGQTMLSAGLQRDLGIKSLLLEADHNDPRSFSNEQAITRLQAFMESFHG